MGWQFEAIAFYVLLPDANGNCPAGTDVLFRLYNNGMGGAPNHRFIRSTTLFNQMRAAEWQFEGNGLTGAYACVPTSPPSPSTAEGYWFGSVSTGANVFPIILDTGLYYLVYTSTSGNALAGLVQGTLQYANGTYSSSDGLDFGVGRGTAKAATVNGSFVAHGSTSGTIAEAATNLQFSAQYQTGYDHPASLAAAAGTFSGEGSFLHGTETAAVTLDASGAFSGTIGACSFTGTAGPRGGVILLNVVFTFTGGPCSYGASTFKGIATFNSNSNILEGVATDAERTDALMFFFVKS